MVELAGVAMAGTMRGAPRLAGMTAARTSAYVDCFDTHFSRLAGYCATMTGDRHVGAEIAQEAFARLFAKWVGVRDPKAYVYLVATNLARERWRRTAKERTAYADVARVDRAQTVSPPDVDLRDLVERLPSRQRDAVLLRYYADLPVLDVAALMSLPEGTVKRLLHEARHALGLALGDDR
ncbi:MAG TPA: RNA polymerase sigma factor [Mycobacteriales bacterium]|nr:RNA polymerase sigma factor [Mycobacteriales bacterium]